MLLALFRGVSDRDLDDIHYSCVKCRLHFVRAPPDVESCSSVFVFRSTFADGGEGFWYERQRQEPTGSFVAPAVPPCRASVVRKVDGSDLEVDHAGSLYLNGSIVKLITEQSVDFNNVNCFHKCRKSCKSKEVVVLLSTRVGKLISRHCLAVRFSAIFPTIGPRRWVHCVGLCGTV